MTSANDGRWGELLASLDLPYEGEAASVELDAFLLASPSGAPRLLTRRLVLQVDASDVLGIDEQVQPGAEGDVLPVTVMLRRGARVLEIADGGLTAELVSSPCRPVSVAVRPDRPGGSSRGRFKELEARFLAERGLAP